MRIAVLAALTLLVAAPVAAADPPWSAPRAASRPPPSSARRALAFASTAPASIALEHRGARARPPRDAAARRRDRAARHARRRGRRQRRWSPAAAAPWSSPASGRVTKRRSARSTAERDASAPRRPARPRPARRRDATRCSARTRARRSPCRRRGRGRVGREGRAGAPPLPGRVLARRSRLRPPADAHHHAAPDARLREHRARVRPRARARRRLQQRPREERRAPGDQVPHPPAGRGFGGAHVLGDRQPLTTLVAASNRIGQVVIAWGSQDSAAKRRAARGSCAPRCAPA